MTRLAIQLGVRKNIEFTGRLATSKAQELISNAAAMIMPSKMESFGIPYYEAMALGCPVVAADKDFSREALGDAGLFAEEDSPGAFATQIAKILKPGKLRSRLVDEGTIRYQQRCTTWTKIAKEFLNILKEM